MDYYPLPTLRREDWTLLNGTWEFAFDDSKEGRREHWETSTLPLLIEVPFAYQAKASGLRKADGTLLSEEERLEHHPVIWYARDFEISAERIDKECFLNFNAVDFSCDVWVNGSHVGSHRGGYTGFSLPVSEFLNEGKNRVALRVVDRHDAAQPRGKQIWTPTNWGCWYTASSGIWQDAWLSFGGKANITGCMITPDLDSKKATFEIMYSENVKRPMDVRVDVYHEGKEVSHVVSPVEDFRQTVEFHLHDPHALDNLHVWTPNDPQLYDVKLTLLDGDGNEIDRVWSYFGMRKVAVENGQILLNDRVWYQKLILDQGYWEDSLLTPPDKEALRKDIELTKAMGFNGIRKHQKFEDPWFYYYASKIGLLVWAEMPSAYYWSIDEEVNVTTEIMEAVRMLYNHPSIITWVPINESWGVNDVYRDVRQQHFTVALYHLIHSMDPTRLVSSNDGWEQTVSDMCTIHDYDVRDRESWDEKWGDKETMLMTTPSFRQVYASGWEHSDEPILLTEMGGIALREDAQDGAWGYHDPAGSREVLAERLEKLMDAIYADPAVKGFCYTQLTDVMQEVNGLLRIDRTPKLPIETYNRFFNGCFMRQ